MESPLVWECPECEELTFAQKCPSCEKWTKLHLDAVICVMCEATDDAIFREGSDFDQHLLQEHEEELLECWHFHHPNGEPLQ